MTSTSESAIRRRARRHGYRVEKARGAEHSNNKGEYMLVEINRNIPVIGWDYDADLEQISEFLEG